MKKIAPYIHFARIATPLALEKLQAHGFRHVLAWIKQEPENRTTLSEHELYGYISDHNLEVAAAFVGNGMLPYLANSSYGRKEALKHYKQAILSAEEHRVPLLVMDALPTGEPFVSALRELADYASDNGVMLCVRDGVDVDTVGLLSEIDNLYYCYDTAAIMRSKQDLLVCAERAQDKLMLVCLGEELPGKQRLVPGTGKVDFAPIVAFLEKIKYQGIWGVSANTAPQGMSPDDMLETVAKL